MDSRPVLFYNSQSMRSNKITQLKSVLSLYRRSHSQGSAGIPVVSYDSADLNRVMSPTKRYKHIGEEI